MDLSGRDLKNFDLTSANLTSANLTNAKLTGANLTGANFTGANFTGANVSGIVYNDLKCPNRGSGDCGARRDKYVICSGIIVATCVGVHGSDSCTGRPGCKQHG